MNSNGEGFLKALVIETSGIQDIAQKVFHYLSSVSLLLISDPLFQMTNKAKCLISPVKSGVAGPYRITYFCNYWELAICIQWEYSVADLYLDRCCK